MTGQRETVRGLALDVATLARELRAWDGRDDTEPEPGVRESANRATRAADRMLSELTALRGQLVTEIRVSDDAAMARTGELLDAGRESAR